MTSLIFFIMIVFTSSVLFTLHILAVAMLSGFPSDAELWGWYTLLFGSFLVVWLSVAVKTMLHLSAYTVLVFGLWAGHGFYLHYLDILQKHQNEITHANKSDTRPSTHRPAIEGTTRIAIELRQDGLHE